MQRVSVVIPCFNAAAHIGNAITSVLSQTRPPDEVIVVDDGSTDDSITEIARFEPAVRIIARANGGAASARNTGIKNITGSLVAFLDADDLWPPGSLQMRLSVMSQTGADLVYGQVRQVIVGADGDRDHGPILTGRVAGTMLVRREIFDRVGGWDDRLRTAESVDWIARAQAAGCMCAHANDIVLVRRIHGANMMLSAPTGVDDRMSVLRAALARKRVGDRA